MIYSFGGTFPPSLLDRRMFMHSSGSVVPSREWIASALHLMKTFVAFSISIVEGIVWRPCSS